MNTSASADDTRTPGCAPTPGSASASGGAPAPARAGNAKDGGRGPTPRNPYLRPANEDDDGYDPYSDRRPEPEPLFERDPWR